MCDEVSTARLINKPVTTVDAELKLHDELYTHAWNGMLCKEIVYQSMLPTCRSIGHILSQLNLHPCSGGRHLLIHWTCLLLMLGYLWSVLADAMVDKNHTQDSNDKCSSACDHCSDPHCSNPHCSNPHSSTCAEGSLCNF